MQAYTVLIRPSGSREMWSNPREATAQGPRDAVNLIYGESTSISSMTGSHRFNLKYDGEWIDVVVVEN